MIHQNISRNLIRWISLLLMVIQMRGPWKPTTTHWWYWQVPLIIECGYLKALVNEDTLLRTHCCPWCFLGCANWETFVAATKCFWTKSETFLLPEHKICVRNKFCARGQTGKYLCRQQCVRNYVSSFARALRVSCFRGLIRSVSVLIEYWWGCKLVTDQTAFKHYSNLEENKGST